MRAWQKNEIQILKLLSPHINNFQVSLILNAVFNTARTPQSIADKKRRLNLLLLNSDTKKALGAIAKSSLPIKLKDRIRKLIQETDSDNPTLKKPQKQYRVETDQNYSVLEQGSSVKPNSLEEMVEIFNIDQDVWMVEKYTVNRWDQAQKTVQGATVLPLYQIKVWLVRKDPIIYKWPAVQPIICRNFTVPKLKSLRQKKLKKAIVIPDSQIAYRRDQKTGYLEPLHDRAVWDVICQIASEEKPDEIILLGDMLDLPDWTDKFLITPDLFFTTQPSLLEFHWWLKRMRSLTSRLLYLEGNHEVRLQKAITRNLIAACGLKPANHPMGPSAMSIPHLLGLEGLGVEYIGPYPQGEYWINDNLKAVHGDVVRQGSGATVASCLKDLQVSVIFGHIHRIEQACKLLWDSRGAKCIQAVSPGTIARLDPGVVPSNKARQNWQNGFASVEYEPGDGAFNIDVVPIIQGSCIYKGKVWTGRDPASIIASDTDWKSLVK